MHVQNIEPWWADFHETVPPGYASFLAAESTAQKTEIFASIIIDGLLQTESYARNALEQHRHVWPSATCEARLQIRLKRQWHAFERPEPLRVHAILDESAVRRRIGSSEEQYEQVCHLLTMARQAHITLQVLPLERGIIWPGISQSTTTCVLIDGHRRFMSREQRLDHINTQNAVEIAGFQVKFTELSELALSAAETQAWLQTLAATLQAS